MKFKNKFKLKIKAFFFNSDTDYLPYYKNFSFSIEEQSNLILKDILKMIQKENPNFSYPDRDLLFRVNNLIVTGRESLSDVVNRLGLELTIDPALKYRSDNGLIFNNHDFIHQFRTLLGHYSTKEDLEFYLKLYPIHYASETFNYNHEYIGDAILILAHKMIKDGNPHGVEIIEAISDDFNGISCCEYENNVFNGVDYGKTIDELKNMVNIKSSSSIFSKLLKSVVPSKRKSYKIDSIDSSSIAIYSGDRLSSNLIAKSRLSIENSGAKFIDFSMSTKLAGQTIINTNRDLAHKKAGVMLLDALDSGAEILAFTKSSDLELFKSIHIEVEKAAGRDIELKLISLDELNQLIDLVEV